MPARPPLCDGGDDMVCLGPDMEAQMTRRAQVVHSDPEILGGTPVFVGTRVPVQTLFDYLEGQHSLEAFLDDFPTVRRKQAVAALEQAKNLLVSSARAA
jgi:uncharacterized protein (DUF433 family)